MAATEVNRKSGGGLYSNQTKPPTATVIQLTWTQITLHQNNTNKYKLPVKASWHVKLAIRGEGEAGHKHHAIFLILGNYISTEHKPILPKHIKKLAKAVTKANLT